LRVQFSSVDFSRFVRTFRLRSHRYEYESRTCINLKKTLYYKTCKLASTHRRTCANVNAPSAFSLPAVFRDCILHRSVPTAVEDLYLFFWLTVYRVWSPCDIWAY